jgi:hypothetical protein
MAAEWLKLADDIRHPLKRTQTQRSDLSRLGRRSRP